MFNLDLFRVWLVLVGTWTLDFGLWSAEWGDGMSWAGVGPTGQWQRECACAGSWSRTDRKCDRDGGVGPGVSDCRNAWQLGLVRSHRRLRNGGLHGCSWAKDRHVGAFGHLHCTCVHTSCVESGCIRDSTQPFKFSINRPRSVFKWDSRIKISKSIAIHTMFSRPILVQHIRGRVRRCVGPARTGFVVVRRAFPDIKTFRVINC